MNLKTTIIAGALCVSAAACGGRAQRSVDGIPSPNAAITVSVQNNNWQDIDVYAVNGSQRVRLGSVTTSRNANFVLPSSLAVATDLRIQVHPLASTRDYLSPRISVSPGDVVAVTVVNALPQTSVVVR